MRGGLGRRKLLGFGAALVPRSARSEPNTNDPPSAAPTFDTLDLTIEGSPDLSRRALVLTPRGLDPRLGVYTLVLLHGLGETTDETAGVHAWIDRYGLLTSYGRLARPPIATRGTIFTSDRARSINDELTARPFRGRMVFVCPYTPNVWRLSNTKSGLDRFADWIADVLLPTVRTHVPNANGPTAIDGCSLGGFVGLEVFIRRPGVFSAWGGVQSAIGRASAARTAERLASSVRSSGRRRLHIETSLRDPYYGANMALANELDKKNVDHDLMVLPGSHDQPWLREAGTLEMLLWHDRGTG